MVYISAARAPCPATEVRYLFSFALNQPKCKYISNVPEFCSTSVSSDPKVKYKREHSYYSVFLFMLEPSYQ